MDLLKGYFRQAAGLVDDRSRTGSIYFRDFGGLEFEKYLSLRQQESAKQTWFFRVDFRTRSSAARYLFFFGYPTPSLRSPVDVTLHVAREEPSGSYYYERLDYLNREYVPPVFEIGYLPEEEKFIVRGTGSTPSKERVDSIVKRFFDSVVKLHFAD